MDNTNPLQTSVFLRTFDLPYPGHKEIPLTLRWDGRTEQPEKYVQFGYLHDEKSPTIVAIDTLQELGFQEVTHYRKFNDSQLYGAYTIISIALIKHEQVVPSLTMFGWIAFTDTHPLESQLFSSSIVREHKIILPDETEISATTVGMCSSFSGGFGDFCSWITCDKLVSDPHNFNLTEALADSRLQIAFWDIHTNENFSTLNL